MIHLNTERLRENQESTWLIVDVIMLVLLVVNLCWLTFDWLFAADAFAALVGQVSPTFHDFYAERVHPDFFRYDLIFVSIFLTEFAVRWIAAIRRGTYQRWYWYPFLHWYEVLGCIPLTGFRMLRLLRIISMVYRLQRLGIIDVTETGVGRFVWHYYQVFVEAVSDRVVINVLEGMQNEIRHGHPVGRHILNQVVVPRKDLLVEVIGERVAELIEYNYNLRREDIREYVNALIAGAVNESKDIARVERVPMLGNRAVDTLERTISDIVFSVLNRAADDLHSRDNRSFVREVLDAVFELILEEHDALDQVSNDMLVDALEVVKERVRRNRQVEAAATTAPSASASPEESRRGGL